MITNAIAQNSEAVFDADTELRPVYPNGWRSGVRNLLRKEAYTWLRTRFGLIQLVLWILIVGGLMVPIIADAG